MPSRTEEVVTDILDEPTPVAQAQPETVKAPAKTGAPRRRRRQTAPVRVRVETYETLRADGVPVLVRRNIDTGEQSVTEL